MREYICKQCGKHFMAKSEKNRMYCSIACGINDRRKIKDTAELLERIKKANGNITAVAQSYGVSDTSIQRALKAAGLPTKSEYYRNGKRLFWRQSE